jgi:hypothetical protein
VGTGNKKQKESSAAQQAELCRLKNKKEQPNLQGEHWQ